MKGFYIYMFLNKENQPLYIGLTTNLIGRIEDNHFKLVSTGLDESCLNEISNILYHECLSSEDMKIKERFLINKLNPKYNISFNSNNEFSFDINIDWYSYDEFETRMRLKKYEKFSLEIQNILLSQDSLDYSKTTNAKISNEANNLLKRISFSSGIPGYKIISSLIIDFYNKHIEDFRIEV
ncbi:GIY-YIG nuclease family protein [Chryseobacterium jejuense]|uniref:GIY-YIG nuclease family protein n=1 Tax=Chryseobacterium jejuense TaxID=445960 RepID=UPI001AE52ADC|nr:GIY-YIG nuclease family protein [Chryseobacterium jejuense]MBP2615819.1 hypothetical protein [Chryseobacterium jejuense]